MDEFPSVCRLENVMPENEELTQYEKLIEGVAQLAAVVKAYYDALRESGLSHKDAMSLTIEYQKSLLGMVKPNG